MPTVNRTELIHRIALTMAPSIGSITARKLIKKFGSARAVFDQNKQILEQIQGIGPRLSASISTPSLLKQAEKELVFLERHRISALYYKDLDYPQRLNLCADGPILLYARGEQGLHCRRSLSVVGTRRATSYGREVCQKLVRGLSERVEGLVIVSGLAYGIDIMAHRAALECGIPTVAVLGHGLSTIYPSSHRETARNIMKKGALVTDFHSGIGPEKNNFLRRNRIIAGLSDATIVVESAGSGGALITADLAVSYGRDVLAVPGRVGDERSKGCNGLIKDNMAALIESPDDVISHLNWSEDFRRVNQERIPFVNPSDKELLILKAIHRSPGIMPGTLSNSTGLPIQGVMAMLVEMELKQWISVEPGNRYRVRINIF